jgi:hypothetical protein
LNPISPPFLVASHSLVDFGIRHASLVFDDAQIGRFAADLVHKLADLRDRAAAHRPRRQLQDGLFANLERAQAVLPIGVEIARRRFVEDRDPVVAATERRERLD